MKEREELAREELSAARAQTAEAEEAVRLASREAQDNQRSLQAQLQVRNKGGSSGGYVFFGGVGQTKNRMNPGCLKPCFMCLSWARNRDWMHQGVVPWSLRSRVCSAHARC